MMAAGYDTSSKRRAVWESFFAPSGRVSLNGMPTSCLARLRFDIARHTDRSVVRYYYCELLGLSAAKHSAMCSKDCAEVARLRRSTISHTESFSPRADTGRQCQSRCGLW